MVLAQVRVIQDMCKCLCPGLLDKRRLLGKRHCCQEYKSMRRIDFLPVISMHKWALHLTVKVDQWDMMCHYMEGNRSLPRGLGLGWPAHQSRNHFLDLHNALQKPMGGQA
jgi:hypothetical protein